MSTLLRKFVLSFLTFLVVFMSFAPSLSAVHAQTQTGTWYNSSFFDWYAKVYDEEKSPSSEIFGERYTAAQVQWVIYGLLSIPLNAITSVAGGAATCLAAGISLGSDATALVTCTQKILTFITGFVNTWHLSGLLSEAPATNTSLAKEMFSTNNRQISGIKYTKKLISKFSIVDSVQAQGFGYTQLQTAGIDKYWAGFRNMAYAIVVLITIIFAFMIMFRVKLNPQTVISVQSALPKIIGAVVLATFSYAIAGFLIDMMYVVGGIFASLLKMSGLVNDQLTTVYQWIMFDTALTSSFSILAYMFAYAIVFGVAVLWSIVIVVSNLSGFGFIVGLVFLVVWVWVVILMLVYTIKVPWVLLKNLISIYISIIVAPLQIIAGTLVPSIGFGAWLKKLISELLVFPVTGLFFYLAWMMLKNSYIVNFNSMSIVWGVNPPQLWAPPIIGSTPAMAGLLWLAASFTFIALLPKVVDMMKAMIMGEKFSFGNAMGEAVGPLNTAWGLTGKPTWDAMARYRENESVKLRMNQLREFFAGFGGRGQKLGKTAGVPLTSAEVDELIKRTEKI